MLANFKARRQQSQLHGEEGFTLIELLVVLLIIGILLAIAIPTFLTVTKSAKNTSSESNLQNALTAAETYYTQNGGSYANIDVAVTTPTVSNIDQQGTGLTFTAAAITSSTTGTPVNIYQPATQNLVLADYSTSLGRCYAIADEKSTVTSLGGNVPSTTGTYYGYWSATSCSGAAAVATSGVPASGAGSWQTSGFPAG